MCISEVMMPKWNKVPLGIDIQVSLIILVLSKNPIGIYFLFSLETLGTTIHVSGLFLSLNNEGAEANF